MLQAAACDPCEALAAAPGSRRAVVAVGARVPAAAFGCRLLTGPSGLEARSSGRAGLPAEPLSRGQKLGGFAYLIQPVGNKSHWTDIERVPNETFELNASERHILVQIERKNQKRAYDGIRNVW